MSESCLACVMQQTKIWACAHDMCNMVATHNVDSDFPGAAGSHVDIVPHMQLYGGALEPLATPQVLRREVIGQVEREVRGEAAYTFNTCTMYMKFWSKSYAFTIIQFLITYSV